MSVVLCLSSTDHLFNVMFIHLGYLCYTRFTGCGVCMGNGAVVPAKLSQFANFSLFHEALMLAET